MKIRKLHIKNYKVFDGLELDFTDPESKTLDMIVLAGENGSGETTILEIIRGLFDGGLLENSEFSNSELIIEIELIVLEKNVYTFSIKRCLNTDEVIKVNYTIKRIGLNSERLNNDSEIQIEETFKLFYGDDGNLLPLPERQKIIELKLKEINNDQNDQITPYYSTIKDAFSFLLNAST